MTLFLYFFFLQNVENSFAVWKQLVSLIVFHHNNFDTLPEKRRLNDTGSYIYLKTLRLHSCAFRNLLVLLFSSLTSEMHFCLYSLLFLYIFFIILFRSFIWKSSSSFPVVIFFYLDFSYQSFSSLFLPRCAIKVFFSSILLFYTILYFLSK